MGKSTARLTLLASLLAPPFGASMVITGSMPVSSVSFGSVPNTVFGSLVMNDVDPLVFSLTYDETVADANPAAQIGQYMGIQQATLTIGSSSVTLNPGAGVGDFDASLSQLQIGLGASDSLQIQIFNSAFAGLSINYIAAAGTFLNDDINPTIGGTTTLDLSDFGGGVSSSAATLFSDDFLTSVDYAPEAGSVTFPNSSTSVPESGTLLLLGVSLALIARSFRSRVR